MQNTKDRESVFKADSPNYPNKFLTGGIRVASTNNDYMYGSVAEKLKYDPYEENAVLRSKKVARNNARLKSRIVFNIFIMFAMCAIIMFRYAQISQLNYNNNQLTKQYISLQNENARLALDIEKAMDLNNIREVAENRLAMHKPDKSQIIYVSVPKKDVIILANKEESKLALMFKDVQNSVKRVLNLLY